MRARPRLALVTPCRPDPPFRWAGVYVRTTMTSRTQVPDISGPGRTRPQTNHHDPNHPDQNTPKRVPHVFPRYSRGIRHEFAQALGERSGQRLGRL